MIDGLYCSIFYFILLNSLCLSRTTLLVYRRSAKFHMLFVAKCLKASCCFTSRCLIQQLLQIRPTKCTHYNVLMCKTPTYFGQQWPIIRVYSCTKQSLGHVIIFNIQNCGETTNVWFRHEYEHRNYKNIDIKVKLL